MKKLFVFVALCIAAASASAEWVLRTKNTNGGEIILTNSHQGCTSGKMVAVARTKGGETFGGCYSYDDSYIYVNWNSGDFRAYDWSGWEVNPRFKKNTTGTSL